MAAAKPKIAPVGFKEVVNVSLFACSSSSNMQPICPFLRVVALLKLDPDDLDHVARALPVCMFIS